MFIISKAIVAIRAIMDIPATMTITAFMAIAAIMAVKTITVILNIKTTDTMISNKTIHIYVAAIMTNTSSLDITVIALPHLAFKMEPQTGIIP